MAPSVSNSGVIISVRVSVVDIGFDEHFPSIYSVLRAGAEKQIVIEVLAQLDVRRVRGIVLIDELLESLNGTFHRLRQSGIDEELFDVMWDSSNQSSAAM